MNREEAKLILPFVTALAEGRQIQTLDVNEGDWEDIDEITVDYFLSHHLDYRIKPEPTYRPFKNAEECWNEMQKHQPFGWVKSKDEDEYEGPFYSIYSTVRDIDLFETKFREFTFADGTPFGMEEVL